VVEKQEVFFFDSSNSGEERESVKTWATWHKKDEVRYQRKKKKAKKT